MLNGSNSVLDAKMFIKQKGIAPVFFLNRCSVQEEEPPPPPPEEEEEERPQAVAGVLGLGFDGGLHFFQVLKNQSFCRKAPLIKFNTCCSPFLIFFRLLKF